MAVLTKKIPAATLMETLVATVLIVVVFMVTSMVLNNLFTGTLANNDHEVRQELLYLQYQHRHNLLELPYNAELGHWQLEVAQETTDQKEKTIFRAVHGVNQREIETIQDHAKD